MQNACMWAFLCGVSGPDLHDLREKGHLYPATLALIKSYRCTVQCIERLESTETPKCNFIFHLGLNGRDGDLNQLSGSSKMRYS